MVHQELIESLIKAGYLNTPWIIDAFQKIDRADFVPVNFKSDAYVNAPLPIGFGQTISQPLTVAFMLEALRPRRGEKILDIGFGSGWQTAILAEIAGKEGKIFAVEIIPELFEFGKRNVEKYGNLRDDRIEFFNQDASSGLPERAPFDKIIAAAAASGHVPMAWKDQIKIGGRIVAPVDNDIFIIEKKSDGDFEEKKIFGFSFVPLVSDNHK